MFRRRQQTPILVPLIIAANILIFILWIVAQQNALLAQLMFENFLVSWNLLEAGRWWTLIGSAFSHNMFWHLFLNMYVLFGFGSVMEVTLGTRKFLFFYLAAGIAGSLTHALVSQFMLGAPELPALGASGAIAGVILLFSLTFPKQGILIFGLIPVPAIFGALLLIGFDLWGLFAQAGGGGLPIGHGAHLGGAFMGILYYLLVKRSRPSTRRFEV